MAAGNSLFEARLNHVLGSGVIASGWPADGWFFSVYPYWPYVPAVIPDDGGGAFVISNIQYCEAHCAGNLTELRVHHATGDGRTAPGWSAQGLSIGSGFDRPYPQLDARQPVSIPDGRGSALITWARRQSIDRGFSPVELCVQRVDADGGMPWGSGGIVVHSFANRRYDQAMAADGSGGAFVFWLDERAPGFYAQHISATGVTSWKTDGIPVATSPTTVVGLPVAVPDGEHGAIVAWAGTSGGRAGVFAQRVTRTGSLPWRGRGVVFLSASLQSDELGMGATPSGGAVLGWRSARAGADDRILAQRLDHEGKLRWEEPAVLVCAAAGSRNHLALVTDRRGGAYFVWADSRPAFAIYGLRLEPSGKPAPGWTRDGDPVCARLPVAISPSEFAKITQIKVTSIEGTGERPRSGDIAASSLGGTAGAQPSEYEFTDESDRRDPSDRPEPRDRGAIMAWVDDRDRQCGDCEYEGSRAFAMLLAPGGPATPPVVSALAAVGAGRIERPFAPSARESRAASAYTKLRVLTTSTPDRSGARIFFSLPGGADVRLFAYDLAGRVVATVARGPMSAGENEVRWNLRDDRGIRVEPGIYVVELRAGAERATARLFVLP